MLQLMGHIQPLQELPIATFATSYLNALCTTAWLWLQAPREAVTTAQKDTDTPEEDASTGSAQVPPDRQACMLLCKRCQKKPLPGDNGDEGASSGANADGAANVWPEVEPVARRRVLAAVLRALEPLGHTPHLCKHLQGARPAMLRDTARTLCALGLLSYSTADWAEIVRSSKPSPSSSEEDKGSGGHHLDASPPSHAWLQDTGVTPLCRVGR